MHDVHSFCLYVITDLRSLTITCIIQLCYNALHVNQRLPPLFLAMYSIYLLYFTLVFAVSANSDYIALLSLPIINKVGSLKRNAEQSS